MGDNLRNELSNRSNNREPLTDDNGEGTKRSLGVNSIQQKRPRFSTPESLQTFVREKQHDQQARGRAMQTQTAVTPASPADELSTLLPNAKGALVCCNIIGGNISNEQKQFNEAIFNVMEALTAKVKGVEDGEATMKNDAAHISPRHMATP